MHNHLLKAFAEKMWGGGETDTAVYTFSKLKKLFQYEDKLMKL